MTIRRTLPALLLALLSLHCSKDNPVAPPSGSPSFTGYVLNEGNFQKGNATLSLIPPDAAGTYRDAFFAANGRGLGDTGNSLALHDGKLYIVMNGSNTVEVVDAATLKLQKTITCPPGASPRYIVFDDAGHAYISNLYRNSVSVYDLAGGVFTAEISVGKNPEMMLVAGGRVYVCNSGFGADHTVSVIDIATKKVTGTLDVTDAPSCIAKVSDGVAVLLCTGAYNDFNDPNDDTPGTMFWLNTATAALSDSLLLGGHPQRIAIDRAGMLYTVQADGIQRVELASKTKTDRFIAGSFYSLGCDRTRSILYVTDALDYVQPGRLHAYTLAGAKLESYPVGIIPGAILF